MRGHTPTPSRPAPPGGHLLYERRPLKVGDGLLAELILNVVGAEPLDHVNVAGRVPEGLRGDAVDVLDRRTIFIPTRISYWLSIGFYTTGQTGTVFLRLLQ